MKRKLLLAFLALFCFSLSWAQTRQVTGRVVSDSASLPLGGVNVTLKGTSSTVATANDGRYTINVPQTGAAVLVFSSVGYATLEVAAGSRATLDVTLTSTSSTLSDVVVIGYQTVRRRDLTGSVSSVGARQLKDIPVNSAAEALAGRLAGVQVTGTEGTPNAEVLIKVRGGSSITQNNSPLYIIDGIQVENALSVISPQDIESVDVLKDASSTSIYGARGANGVVIITTKGGRAQKPVISYNGQMGIDRVANKLDVMQPYDFVMYQYERSRGSSADQAGFLNTYGRFEDLDLYKSVPFVDWQEQMFGRNAFRQTHNVSLNGGSNGTTYNLSLTYNRQEGVQLGSDFDRKLVNFKFDHTFSKLVRVGFNTRYNNTTVNGAGTSNPGSSSTNRLRHSIKYRPFLLPGQDLYDYDVDYANETNANSLGLVNPILLNSAEYRQSRINVTNLNGYLELKPTDFLTFRSTVGVDIYTPRLNSFDDSITGNSKLNGAGNPLAAINMLSRYTFNNSNVLTLSNARLKGSFNQKNKLTLLLGHELFSVNSEEQNILARDFARGISPEKAFGNMNMGTSYIDNSRLPTSENEERLVSFFGRLMYDFDQRLLAQFSVRADGSSKFGPENKWGYFPSASLAWRLYNENFFEGLRNVFSDAKIRVSYGESGNNRIGNALYLTQYGTATQYWLNNQLVGGYYPLSLANPLLKWETTVSKNLGFDFSFLKNRIQFSADIYENEGRDLLINVPIPANLGYSVQVQNVASTISRGVELQLNAAVVAKKDFGWDANFNISFGRVKIEKLSDYVTQYLRNSGWGFSNTPADFVVRKGEYIGSMWGFVTDGIYNISDFDYANGVYTLKQGVASNSTYTSVAPQPGRLKFKDVNGDGMIDENDKQIIGVAQPKFFGGFGNQFRYKNFDLSVFVNFQYGNQVYNANRLEFTSGYQANANLLAVMNNRWRTVNSQGAVVTDPVELAKLNPNPTLWTPSTASTSFTLHSWAIEDGSFIRINNVTLGYNFPVSITRRAKMQSLRAYVTVNNLAVFTRYSGYDPEVNTRRNTPETPGVDYSAYPRSRSFLAGINLTF